MAYIAATSEGFLLKYLEAKSSGHTDSSIALVELVEDFRRLQTLFPKLRVYDFEEADALEQAELTKDLVYLHELGFISYEASNPHVRLRELGRFYAELLELPLGIADKVTSAIEKSSTGLVGVQATAP